MTKLKKVIKRTILIFLIFIPISAFVQYIFFPQQTRSILIEYSDFKKDGRLYFNCKTPQNSVDTVKLIIKLASNRVAEFWGQKKCNPKFIYCKSEGIFKNMEAHTRFQHWHT